MLVDPVYWRSRDAGWLFVKRIEISPESIQHQRCPSLRRIDPPLLKDNPRMNSIVSSSFDRMRKMAACSFRAFRAVDAQLFCSGDRWRRNARVLVFLCCVCFASVEGPPLLDKFRSSSTIRSSRELHWHWYTTIFNDFSLAEFYGILSTDNVVHGFWHVVFTSHHESKVEFIRKRFNYKLRSSSNSSTFIHRRVHIFFTRREV